MVCVPKEEGGLGVINIEKQTAALLLTNLHKFLTDRTFTQIFQQTGHSLAAVDMGEALQKCKISKSCEERVFLEEG